MGCESSRLIVDVGIGLSEFLSGLVVGFSVEGAIVED